MLTFLLAILVQGQFTFGQVVAVQNCTWTGTANASIQNTRIAMYSELKAIPVTAAIFAQFRITVVSGSPDATNQPDQYPSGVARVTFSGVNVTGDHIYGFTAGEQNCITWESQAMLALVGLNNAQVDAVLTKYKVQIVNAGVQVFPR